MGFKEDQENRYIFQDTKPETLLSFVEWAYKDDYSVKGHEIKGNMEGDNENDEITDDENALLHHAEIYIFAETYGVASLKDLAFDNIFFHCKYEWSGQYQQPLPNNFWSKQLNRLLPVFALCYADKLPEGDELLIWLGKLASSRFRKFRGDPTFLTILPRMLPYVVKHLEGSSRISWEEEPKLQRDAKRQKLSSETTMAGVLSEGYDFEY